LFGGRGSFLSGASFKVGVPAGGGPSNERGPCLLNHFFGRLTLAGRFIACSEALWQSSTLLGCGTLGIRERLLGPGDLFVESGKFNLTSFALASEPTESLCSSRHKSIQAPQFLIKTSDLLPT
jgi:hypothetical protein